MRPRESFYQAVGTGRRDAALTGGVRNLGKGRGIEATGEGLKPEVYLSTQVRGRPPPDQAKAPLPSVAKSLTRSRNV